MSSQNPSNCTVWYSHTTKRLDISCISVTWVSLLPRPLQEAIGLANTCSGCFHCDPVHFNECTTEAWNKSPNCFKLDPNWIFFLKPAQDCNCTWWESKQGLVFEMKKCVMYSASVWNKAVETCRTSIKLLAWLLVCTISKHLILKWLRSASLWMHHVVHESRAVIFMHYFHDHSVCHLRLSRERDCKDKYCMMVIFKGTGGESTTDSLMQVTRSPHNAVTVSYS